MKHSSLLLLLACLISSCVNQKEADLSSKGHPRIILQSAPVDHRNSRHPYLGEMQSLLLETADSILTLESPERIIKGRRLLGVSRSYLKRISYLAYAWHLTGEDKYIEKAEALMLKAASFSDWNPSHYLDVAEMTTALAIGYDWLYNELKEESKLVIKKAIVNSGLKPSIRKYYGWIDNTNNWNQVCNTGMALGAWAVYEDHPEMADSIIARTAQNILIPQEEYNPDGVYPEGASYWDYGTGYNVLFNAAWESIVGENCVTTTGFDESAMYYLHVVGPQGNFNFSDGGQFLNLSPAIFWYAMKSANNSLLYNQLPILEKLIKRETRISARGSDNRLLPFLLLWMENLLAEFRQLPSELSWTGEGPNPVSMHRTAWTEDAVFIGIKGGSPSLSHAHMDIGSFVMDAKGVRWAIDLGSHDYHSLESQGIDLWNKQQDGQRWEIFRYSNHGHSTLVVDDQPQLVDEQARIIHSFSTKDRTGAQVDMTPVYAQSLETAIRTIAIEKASLVRIKDSLANNSHASSIRWAMVTVDSMEMLSANKARLHHKGASLIFEVHQPEQARINTWSTKPWHDWESDNPETMLIGFEFNLAESQSMNCDVSLLPE